MPATRRPFESAFARRAAAALPVNVPAGYRGPVQLPGSGRMVWWTGRVAIGLRHALGEQP